MEAKALRKLCRIHVWLPWEREREKYVELHGKRQAFQINNGVRRGVAFFLYTYTTNARTCFPGQRYRRLCTVLNIIIFHCFMYTVTGRTHMLSTLKIVPGRVSNTWERNGVWEGKERKGSNKRWDGMGRRQEEGRLHHFRTISKLLTHLPHFINCRVWVPLMRYPQASSFT